LAGQTLSFYHIAGLAGVVMSLFACGLWRVLQDDPWGYRTPEGLQQVLRTITRTDRNLMIVQSLAMTILLALSIELGFRQLLAKRPADQKKPQVPAKLLRYSTLVLQLTVVALLVIFVREAMLASGPWAGPIWLRPWWSVTIDGLMVWVPLFLASVLDVAEYRRRLRELEIKAAMPTRMLSLSVLANRTATAVKDKPPCP
jgi:hypothetical protein